MSGMAAEETLRLQFGTASNSIGTQWLALRDRQDDARLMRADGKPRLIAFEAKDRIRRHRVAPSTAKRSRTTAEIQEQAAWTGNVQVYDQSHSDSAATSDTDANAGLWSWASCSESNLFEVSEFRSHMPLHNFYEGYGTAKDGAVSAATLDAVEDRLRCVLEECDRLRLVQSLVDMDSSWGGFAHEVLTYVSEECPRAVVVTFGNDWAYPLADQSAESVFALAPDSRDRAKNDARRRINIGSALSLLTEVSSLLVPLAMTPESSLPHTRFAHLQLDRASCGDMSALAATAIELALSAHRAQSSASAVVEGVMPGMKVMALAARFPYGDSPESLLQCITDESEVSLRGGVDALADECSLLPVVPETPATRRFEDEDDGDDGDTGISSSDKVFARRLHLRGGFAAASSAASLSLAVERSRSAQCVVQWTPVALQLPSSYRVGGLADVSIDAVSQLSASSRVGRYLRHVMRDVQRADKRVLFEFTRAGMNPDALEDLDASLGTLRDAYLQ